MPNPALCRCVYGATLCLLTAFFLAQAGCSGSNGDDPASQPTVDSPAVESLPAATDEALPAEEIAQPPAPAEETVQIVPPVMPPEEPGEPADPFAVPDGTPEEILAYLETLAGQRPKTNDIETVMAFQRNICNALITAGERILAAEPDEEQAMQAAHAKFAGLSILNQMGDAEAGKRREALPGELKKAGHASLGRMIEAGLLQERLQAIRTAGSEEVDELIGELKAFVGEGAPQPEDVQLARSMAQALEQAGNTEKAAEVYRDFGKMLAAAEDAQIAEMGTMMGGAARRITLVGNKMPLEGVTLAGESLDWAKYEGKVVLVDFWATWCGPCLAELPNIRANYDLYHDRGFEVIGISVDEDREALEGFLKNNDFPWTILFDQQDEAAPETQAMAQRYGVFGIPTVVLIGQDGNVVALNVRGEQLGQELETLLGPPTEEKPKEE